MGQIRINCIRVGMLPTNCYIVYDEEIKQAVIVDPGDNADFLSTCIEKMGAQLKGILLTHAHFDHILGIPGLREKFEVPVYVSEADAPMLSDASLNLGMTSIPLQNGDVTVHDGDVLQIAGIELKVIATPGHTPGGVCYYMEKEHVLFSGDTMFRFSWGRTDFPGGSERALMSSIREKLLPLPAETVVYPGHEGSTTIADERRMHGYKE